jgi:hypothetical protein
VAMCQMFILVLNSGLACIACRNPGCSLAEHSLQCRSWQPSARTQSVHRRTNVGRCGVVLDCVYRGARHTLLACIPLHCLVSYSRLCREKTKTGWT